MYQVNANCESMKYIISFFTCFVLYTLQGQTLPAKDIPSDTLNDKKMENDMFFMMQQRDSLEESVSLPDYDFVVITTGNARSFSFCGEGEYTATLVDNKTLAERLWIARFMSDIPPSNRLIFFKNGVIVKEMHLFGFIIEQSTGKKIEIKSQGFDTEVAYLKQKEKLAKDKNVYIVSAEIIERYKNDKDKNKYEALQKSKQEKYSLFWYEIDCITSQRVKK